jgi:chorismate mutase
MSDIFEKVSGEQDFFKKILSKIPGFKGYIERGNRRMSDKLLRENVANEFETLYGRISSLQRDLISQGGIAYVDDLEAAAIKLRQFIDRVKTASYGYAGLFDAIKIKEDKLEQVYQYDYALLTLSNQVSAAIDNVETSIGTEGLDAAIRNLVSVSQQCVDAFNKRSEVMKDVAAEQE